MPETTFTDVLGAADVLRFLFDCCYFGIAAAAGSL